MSRHILSVFLFASVVAPTKGTPIAIVGSFVPCDALQRHLTTDWTLVPSDNASSSAISQAEAFVETPLAILGGASAGRLYQYAFTGFKEEELALIPAKFAVANAHQSSVAIAEYVMASILEFVVGLRGMDESLRECTWRSSPPGNTCTRRPHRQISNLTLGILGYGHIGEAIAHRAAAFGMRIIATTLGPPAVPVREPD